MPTSEIDVLRPPLVWVGGRCYRATTSRGEGRNPEDEDLEYDGYQGSNNMYCDEACDADVNIEETDRGYRLVMEVPSPFYKYIIGKQGATKKRIESESRTQIMIPKQGSHKEEIVINGRDKKGVTSTKTRIDLLIDSARQKEQFTHFLSVPVNSEEIYLAFDDFKFQVLNKFEGDRGLDASLFQTREKLHLTIGTLVLLNDSEIQSATDLLSQCQEEIVNPILKGKKLEVRIQGLEYMNDDPNSVDVLYAKVQPGEACDSLQMLADRLVDKFTRVGLMQQQHDRVKLHATVMNTLMRKDPSGTTVPRHAVTTEPRHAAGKDKIRESFDASNLLKNLKDLDFGKLPIDKIHLSQRYSTHTDGYYKPASVLQLVP